MHENGEKINPSNEPPKFQANKFYSFISFSRNPVLKGWTRKRNNI